MQGPLLFIVCYHSEVGNGPLYKHIETESLKRGKEVDNAATASQKAALCKEYGITGVSIFYKWYNLCKFDPVKDLVIDMHVVLNLARNELEILLGRGNTEKQRSIVNRSQLADL